MDKSTEQYIRTEADIKAYDHGCRFDQNRADHIVRFFPSRLVHPHGPLYGKPYELIKWQRDEVLKPLFGWVRPDGKRRFTKAYIEVPKKNNKTGLCAGIVNYLLAGEGKGGKKIYSAAADRKQAAMIYDDAAHMIHPQYKKHFKFTDSAKLIKFSGTNNEYRALSAEADTAEGLRIYGLIFDELHVQSNRKLWRSLHYGMAAEAATDEPLMIIITTAGIYDPESIGWEQHKYATTIIDGTCDDTSEFALIYGASEGDDWKDPAVWRKANPSLGITISEAEMASSCKAAQVSPAAESEFRRYRLDQWVNNINRHIAPELWGQCSGELPMLDGCKCYAGLDLGLTDDITAIVLLFTNPNDDNCLCLIPHFWMCSETLKKFTRRGANSWDAWAASGMITITDGDVTDFGRVERDVIGLSRHYDIQELGMDKWNASQMMQNFIEADIQAVDFPQWGKYFNEPMKGLPVLLSEKRIIHGNHPIMNWMCANLDAIEDKYGYLKPVKESKGSDKKVDGMIALLMAIGLWQRSQSVEEYEYTGIFGD